MYWLAQQLITRISRRAGEGGGGGVLVHGSVARGPIAYSSLNAKTAEDFAAP